MARLWSQTPPLLPESRSLLRGSAPSNLPAPAAQRISYRQDQVAAGRRSDHPDHGRPVPSPDHPMRMGDALSGSGPLATPLSIIPPVQRWTPQSPPAAAASVMNRSSDPLQVDPMPIEHIPIEPIPMDLIAEEPVSAEVMPVAPDPDDGAIGGSYTPLTSTSFEMPLPMITPGANGPAIGNSLAQQTGRHTSGPTTPHLQRSWAPNPTPSRPISPGPSAVQQAGPHPGEGPDNLLTDPIRVVRPKPVEVAPPAPVQRSGPMSFDTMFGSYASGPRQPDLPVQRATEVSRTDESTTAPGSGAPRSATDESASQPAPISAPPTPGLPASAPPAAAGTTESVDELARRLFEPLSARIKAELWLDRERAGLITDVRS
ncbi:hypothetical protein [Microlunatus sp. Gsoil 973]|uniref:hypothetical protein n=1 Tax=Microlunatus sp. Gsoil 973 TaxID=2672569 RepID=UPI0012B44B68|nr:hypothetical protein [Microlunatus sp. Gsoil 973]QGN34973.1 hypothetical protein GJV80_21495 [Microlunatus sp. Gsoil 973]